MSYDFNANDIFEMAENIEENGAVFYRQAANSIEDKEENKSFLINLAVMEEEHKRIFSAMRNELSKRREMNDTVFDPENEALSYLKALADIQVFFKKNIDISSMESILKAAIIAEKDSIVFYLGMKNLIPEDMGRSKIDDIVMEEMSHIKLLSNYLRNLKD